MIPLLRFFCGGEWVDWILGKILCEKRLTKNVRRPPHPVNPNYLVAVSEARKERFCTKIHTKKHTFHFR